MNDHSELVGDMAELVMEFKAKYSKQNSYIKLLQKVSQMERPGLINLLASYFYKVYFCF